VVGATLSPDSARADDEDPVVVLRRAADWVRSVTLMAYEEDYKAGKLEEHIAKDLLESAEKCIRLVDEMLANPATAGATLDLNGFPDRMPIADVKKNLCIPGLEGAKRNLNARMESLAWPADAQVGNAKALKSATLAWWKGNHQTVAPAHRVDKAEVVAVAVRGGWESGATNEWDETTRWDVPVWVAVTNPTLRAEGVAMVYDCRMVTKEARYVKKVMPFFSSVYGAPFRMALAKVPGAR
jgi:hypothetical protein